LQSLEINKFYGKQIINQKTSKAATIAENSCGFIHSPTPIFVGEMVIVHIKRRTISAMITI